MGWKGVVGCGGGCGGGGGGWQGTVCIHLISGSFLNYQAPCSVRARGGGIPLHHIWPGITTHTGHLGWCVQTRALISEPLESYCPVDLGWPTLCGPGGWPQGSDPWTGQGWPFHRAPLRAIWAWILQCHVHIDMVNMVTLCCPGEWGDKSQMFSMEVTAYPHSTQ